MRLLILGGTVFLGRHVVDAALERGHELTLYTRGKHGTGPEGVEHIAGDRADVTPLKSGRWNAAIDTSGYDPAQVDASSALDVGHYVFVSSCNAYPDWPDKPVDEDSPTCRPRKTVPPRISNRMVAYGSPCSRAPLTDASSALRRYSASASAEPNRPPGAFCGPWWVSTQCASASRRSSGSS